MTRRLGSHVAPWACLLVVVAFVLPLGPAPLAMGRMLIAGDPQAATIQLLKETSRRAARATGRIENGKPVWKTTLGGWYSAGSAVPTLLTRRGSLSVSLGARDVTLQPTSLPRLGRREPAGRWRSARYTVSPDAMGAAFNLSFARLFGTRQFSWSVGLLPGQRLVQVNPHLVALVAAPAPGVPVTGYEGPRDPRLGSTAPSRAFFGLVASQLHYASAQQSLLRAHLRDLVLLTFAAPQVAGVSAGRATSSIQVRGATIVVSVRARRRSATNVHAVAAVSGGASRAQARLAQAEPPRTTRAGAIAPGLDGPRTFVGAAFRTGGSEGLSATWSPLLASCVRTPSPGYSGGVFAASGRLEPSASVYAATAATYFDSITAENELKMDFLEPCPGDFTFTTADATVNWARAAGLAVHGHALLWNGSVPSWLPLALTSVAVAARACPGMPPGRGCAAWALRTYVTTVVRHFAGRVSEWDVVNEAIDFGSCTATGCPQKTAAAGIFYQALGAAWTRLPFLWAHAADPSARLFYTDGAAGPGAQGNGMFVLADALVKAGIPLDGVGFQMHLRSDSPLDGRYREIMARFHELTSYRHRPVTIEVTEMDVQQVLRQADYSDGSLPSISQDAVYTAVAAACHAVACAKLTTWGITDALTWRDDNTPPSTGHSYPLLFSGRVNQRSGTYALKPAWDYALAGLSGAAPKR